MEHLIQNIRKGIEKIIDAAIVFSAWIKEWIDALLEQLRVSGMQSRIDELHLIIGRRVAQMRKEKTVSSAIGQLLKDAEITEALAESDKLEKELAGAAEDTSDEDAREPEAHEKKDDAAA